MTAEHKQDIRDGSKDSVPIALAYFAVAFSLGIAARAVGMSPLLGYVYSALNFTSTGEYAGFQLMAEHASLVAVFVMTLVVNARYILMGAALSQRIPVGSPFWHRFIYAQSITDEIFAVSIHRTKPLTIWYSLAAILPANIGWSAGTALGLSMGNILPERLVMALGVALFGLFIGIIIPPAKENHTVLAIIAVSFALSFLFAKVPPMSHLSSGNRIILLTILIAGAAAALFPVEEDEFAMEEILEPSESEVPHE